MKLEGVENDDDEPVLVRDFKTDSENTELEDGQCNIVFAHPESLVSCEYESTLKMHSKIYQINVCAIVVDKAHCILECWVAKKTLLVSNFVLLKKTKKMGFRDYECTLCNHYSFEGNRFQDGL